MNQRETPPPAPVMSERRVSLLGAMLVGIGPVSLALFTPALPRIVEAFATSEAAVKLTITLYFAGFAFTQLISGPLSDGFGRKPVAVVFMGLYVLASLAAVMAPSIEVLIAARFLQGVGAAAGVAVARAVVRDLFVHEQSARVMNLIGIILAVGPAAAPTIGGFTMAVAGWQSIFALMLAAGVAIIAIVILFQRETVSRDLTRIRPRELLRSYRILLGSRYFMAASLAIAGTSGAIYTLATLLPFVLITRAGLTPAEFGLSMVMQTGMFFIGSLIVRQLLARFRPGQLVLAGAVFVALASVLVAVATRIVPPSFASVMGPIAIYAFGIAFVMPVMQTAALAPFPRMAGSASAMAGFLQMGAGLLGGSVGALFADPVTAMEVVIPVMGLCAVVAVLVWRRLPEPERATVVRSGPIAPA